MGICSFFILLLCIIHYGRKSEYHITLKGVVLSADNAALTIQGDPQNDVGQRGQYIIQKNDNIAVRNSSGDSIGFSSLAIGDHVEIHYIDYIVPFRVRQYHLDDDAKISDVQQINVIE